MKELMVALQCAVLLIGTGACGSHHKDDEQPASKSSNAEVRHASDKIKGGRYHVIPAKSRFTAQVGVGGLLAAAGHPHTIAIRQFDGDLDVDSGSLDTSLQMTIKSESLGEVGKEFDEDDRKKVNQSVHGEALETTKYPQIVFKGTTGSIKTLAAGQYEATIKGNLTLHGVTRQISFPAKVRLEQGHLRATGEFTILHSQYNLKRLSAAGGTVKAKDEIVLSFDLQAEPG